MPCVSKKHNHTISTLVHISFLKREMKQCGFYFDEGVLAPCSKVSAR